MLIKVMLEPKLEGGIYPFIFVGSRLKSEAKRVVTTF